MLLIKAASHVYPKKNQTKLLLFYLDSKINPIQIKSVISANFNLL